MSKQLMYVFLKDIREAFLTEKSQTYGHFVQGLVGGLWVLRVFFIRRIHSDFLQEFQLGGCQVLHRRIKSEELKIEN